MNISRWWPLAALLTLGHVTAACADGSSADAYLVQPGDILMVSAWKEPDLQAELAVRPDGRVSFPLAGDVVAAERTVEELQAELEGRLRKYVPDVLVTVTVKAVAGNRVYVIGKVGHPGDFVLSRPTDVMQALGLAGGTTPFADLESIRILRREPGRQRVLEFRYTDVERGRHLEQNVLLKAGDTVVVP